MRFKDVQILFSRGKGTPKVAPPPPLEEKKMKGKERRIDGR